MTGRATSEETCQVLREDLDLAEALPPQRRPEATERLTARLLTVPPGPWAGDRLIRLPGGIGLLVLKGMIVHRLTVDGRSGAELLGECDILRPWQGEDGSPTLSLDSVWVVAEPTRLAVLDSDFARQLVDYPELVGRLVSRAVQRCRQLTINMAIVHQARVDVRLHMLFWHFAARWGRVRSDGTLLPLRLTHALLADLVAARRPTVTSALSDLARRGLVRFTDEGWLLLGNPPRETSGAAIFA